MFQEKHVMSGPSDCTTSVCANVGLQYVIVQLVCKIIFLFYLLLFVNWISSLESALRD